jgi:hypothetical protein
VQPRSNWLRFVRNRPISRSCCPAGDLDVAEPHDGAVVLQADVALAAEVLEGGVELVGRAIWVLAQRTLSDNGFYRQHWLNLSLAERAALHR